MMLGGFFGLPQIGSFDNKQKGLTFCQPFLY